VNQALWLIDHAPKEALDKLRSGEKAISNLYKKIKGRKEPAEPPPWLSFIVASTVSVPEVIPLFADWQLHDAEHFKESIIFYALWSNSFFCPFSVIFDVERVREECLWTGRVLMRGLLSVGSYCSA